MNDELEYLTKYRFTKEKIHVPHTKLEDIFNDSLLQKFLHGLMKDLKAPNLKVTSSIFMKRYAFLAVIQLAVMSIYNKAFRLSKEQMYLQHEFKDGMWLPNFYFEDYSLVSLPDDVRRKEWRSEVISSLFKRHFNPLMNLLYKKTKISKKVLWENVFVYISWFYESALEDKELCEHHEILKDDYRFITDKANGPLYGAYSENPLTIFYEQRERGVNIRKTCCFSYLIESKGGRCKTCPLICNIEDIREVIR